MAQSDAYSTGENDGPGIRLQGLQRRPDVPGRQVGLDLSLYDPMEGRMYLLNPTAASVWHHITPGRTIQQIGEALALTFQLDPEDVPAIVQDVKYVVSEFRRRGLLIGDDEESPREDRRKEKPRSVRIPDREVFPYEGGYVRPTFKSFSLDELDEIFEGDLAHPQMFADTWNPLPEIGRTTRGPRSEKPPRGPTKE